MRGPRLTASPIGILLVDGDDEFRHVMTRRLRQSGHRVFNAATASAALELAERERIEVALVDLKSPGMDGIVLLEKLKAKPPGCEVVLLTDEATIETAVLAMKRGAFDYLTKPRPLDEVENILIRAYEHFGLSKENRQLREALQRSGQFGEMIGNAAAMRHVGLMIEKAAPSRSPVLIQGESGTGKELVARALHRHSRRADKPIVTINCAALQETLLESELFGHEKGAFTGATAAKLGLFEVADGGTLFIDELGELATGLQAKLLRFLEDGSLRRVGATREQTVDVRVIAATNRDLHRDVKAGRFRDDLYYRLNVVTIQMPPLRERHGDIPLLVDHFLSQAGSRWRVTDEARAALGRYHWPGNVRELANVIERATILAEGDTIELADLPVTVHQTTGAIANAMIGVPSGETLANVERRHVESMLKRQGFNRVRTARILGISRRSLYRLIAKYGIQTPGRGPSESGNPE